MSNCDQNSDNIPSDKTKFENKLQTILKQTIDSSNFGQQKKTIEWITDMLMKEKVVFFQSQDFYHYFCLLTETAIEEQYITTIENNLNKFWTQITYVCYQWKSLSEIFNKDFYWFNSIQLSLKSIFDKLMQNDFNNNIVVDKCVPLMFDSMIAIVSTIHDFEEVLTIAKPISQIFIDRKRRGLHLSDEWKELMSHVKSVFSFYSMISCIEKMDEKTFCGSLLIVFDYGIGKDPFLRHISKKTINIMSREKHLSLDELFVEYQFEISAHILNLINIRSTFEIELLIESMSFFEINLLPEELVKHILPHFAIRCNEESKLFIDEIAKNYENSVAYVIRMYLSDILCLIFSKNFERNNEKIKNIIDFLSVYSKYDLRHRIQLFDNQIVNAFLLKISKDFDSALEGLAFVYYNERREQELDLKLFYNNELLLRNYLTEKDYFLPFIHCLDRLLINCSTTYGEKITAVESLVVLIKLMGNQCITLYRVKIFATIKLIVSESFYSIINLIKLGLEAMMQFIKAVDDSYLSSQLLTISALILPLMHKKLLPNETAILFKELIITHRNSPQFQSAFKHLYFIPEIPELSEVNNVLKPYITIPNRTEDVCKSILLVVNNLNHENSKVQELSLQELLKLLNKHKVLLYKLCNDTKDENCDNIVNKIVLNLMSCMKSNVSEVLLLTAECLGILGAIDPSRIDLDKPIISKEENCERFLNSNDKNFKIVLMTLLMKAITTSAKTSDQNCSSFALQEIIKYFTSPQVINRIDINRDLNQELRDYCNVLLKSKYNNPIPFRSSQETTEVIFGSNPDMKYNQWLNEWLKTLFNSFIFLEEDSNEDQTNRNSILSQSVPSQLSGEFNSALEEVLTQNQIPIDILRFSFHAIIRNQSIAQFLLPYVVIASLRSANLGQKQLIVNEVKTIIAKLTTEETKFSEDIIHLSSQTVFHLYDHLKVWFKNRNALHKTIGKTPRYLKTAQMRDREFKGVKYFLENISGLELATLAFNCNAFSRSLRYLEEYVKENDLKTGANSNTFQEKISFFQKIFVRLDEPDSVEGCNSKRTKTPTFDETILTHESMGQIQEALTCCAKAVQLFPSDFKYQEKYLQTLMQSFDQSDMVYTYGSGLMLRQPESKAKIAPFVIEAVWKLGNWDELQNQLECHRNESFTTFGSGIGELFSSIINKQTISDFEDRLRFMRQQLVGPLSAAAMEISGYVRGHQYIVNLHILNDIQTAYNKLITKLTDECCDIDKFQNKFLKVVNIWEERNDMVRKTSRCQEPILNVQRAIFSIMHRECDFLSPFIKKQLFKSWLKSTKTSRKSGNIQRSYNCTLEMNKSRQSLSIYSGDGIIPVTVTELTDSENSEAISEVAKVHWARNDKLVAIKFLRNEIEQHFSENRRHCCSQAIHSLDKQFSCDELAEMANSLQIILISDNQSTNESTPSVSLSSNRSSAPLSNRTQDKESNEAFAKLQLLYTKYCDDFGALDINTLMLMYKSVTIAYHNWEESHYRLGMYCNKIFVNYEESQRSGKSYSLGRPEEILELKGRVVKSLAESLKYGVKHAHNSLPRLLNIWFDLGTELHQNSNKSKQTTNTNILGMKKTLDKISSFINDLLNKVPSFVFYISFAQLTSRILHPNALIAKTLKSILAKLICDYCHQSMWLLIRSCNSYNSNRRNCCSEILNLAIKEDKSGLLKKFIPDILKFAELLNNLCEKLPDLSNSNSKNTSSRRTNLKQMSLKKDFVELSRFFSSDIYSPILLPFNSLINVSLPTSVLKEGHIPFPSKDVFIERFDDCIELLNSLQRPKKIRVNGSDGKTYIILLKRGDDLRKDNGLIEFCNLMNRCFKRDPETRRRQLGVKTYLVVPLNDTNGIIEWIPGLSPYRGLVENQYRSVCVYDDIKNFVINNYPNRKLAKNERVRRFISDILPKFRPSVFSQWFVSNYSDPLSWFSARLAFTRSSAVFSIVGYLLGLGDRHGENIMIDETTGETVHVDFNCLFNKGEEFQVPERVPFRLTDNMVNAMGVTQFEGTFRKACEHTLRIARDNREAFMNFVTPFRFDHLYEWIRNKDTDSRGSRHESLLTQAETIVFNVEARLNGIPSRNSSNLPKGISLSVEGQVDHVIKESIDVQNLGVMYVGWAAYL